MPIVVLLLVLLTALMAAAQSVPATSQTLLVLPFENTSKAPGLEWIGEAFPEVLGQRMGSASLYVVQREDRAYAFDRAGVPAHLRPSHATLFRIGEQMDVDFLVLGRYDFNGQTFTATAQLLDVKRLRLSPAMSQAGPLTSLIDVQTALAWDLLRLIKPGYNISRNEFLASSRPIRLDAFENYVRGVTASTQQEKVQRLRDAIRLNPSYTPAILQLGRAYFAARDYEQAAAWFARVPRTVAEGREASFYAGLSSFYTGDYARAESAFSFLASQFPLTEVYNDLGVVAARRGKATAAEYFHKAVEADPSDPDYRFNLGLALYRGGDLSGSVRQLGEAVKLRPSDAEAKSLLETVSSNPSTGAAHLHPTPPNAGGVGTPLHPTPPNAGAAGTPLPLERIKRNYDETSFRQLALEIQNATEARLAHTDPHTHATYHVGRGHDLLQQHFVADAGQEFREAIVLEPANAAAHAGLAAVLEASNDVEGARKEVASAMKLQPTAGAYLVLARLDLRDNNSQAAAANLDRALTLEPANAAALALKRAITPRRPQKP